MPLVEKGKDGRVPCYTEGKKIDGQYYVIMVFNDHHLRQYEFHAYEMETDTIHKLQYKYTDFDQLFKHNAVMMNPNMEDERYHWVMQRLDFVCTDYVGAKKLCLAPEPTALEVKVKEAADPVKQGTGKPSMDVLKGGAGKESAINQEDRVRLLNELATFDQSALHDNLVEGEAARKRLLAEIGAKQVLEKIKAAQRMGKIDDERATRVAVLRKRNQDKFARMLLYKQQNEEQTKQVQELQKLLTKRSEEAVADLSKIRAQEKEENENAKLHASERRSAIQQTMKERKLAEQLYHDRQQERRARSYAGLEQELRAMNDEIGNQRMAQMEQIDSRKHAVARNRLEQSVLKAEAMSEAHEDKARKAAMWVQLEQNRAAKDMEAEMRREIKSDGYVAKLHSAYAQDNMKRAQKNGTARAARTAFFQQKKIVAKEMKKSAEVLNAKRAANILKKEDLREIEYQKKIAHEEYMKKIGDKSSLVGAPTPESLGFQAQMIITTGGGGEIESSVQVGQEVVDHVSGTVRTEKNQQYLGQQQAVRHDMEQNLQKMSEKARRHAEVAKFQKAQAEKARMQTDREQFALARETAKKAEKLNMYRESKAGREMFTTMQKVREQKWKVMEVKKLESLVGRISMMKSDNALWMPNYGGVF